jgi:hypothetical protein
MDVPARVEGIRPFLFHGAEWVQLYFSHLNDSKTIRSEQFSRDSLPAGMKVGDEIVVFYLLGTVASVRLRSMPDSADAG